MKQGAVVQLEEAKKQLARLNAEFEDERNSFAGKSRDYEDRLSRLSNEQLIASKSTADLQRQLEELEKKASLQQQEANTAARRAAEDLQAEQRSNEVKFNALKKEKLVIESQLSSEAATASRALADLESAKLAAESKVREREGQIEEVRAQLRGVNERLEAAKAQGQGDLRGLQEQLNALRSSSREENDSLQKQLREAKAKTSSLQADFDQLKSSSTRNGTQLQQANIELQAELKEERASKEALRTAKEEESSRLSSQLTLLQSKMDAALAQARRDLTGTSDELKRTSAQNASKIDELLRRVRELESELNSKSTELNITTEQRNNARESLAKLTAVHKDYKLELEEKVADLSGKLERVTADAKSAQQLAAAERKGLQSQVHNLLHDLLHSGNY
jgi:chromosome segregation ATPase